MPHPSTHSIYPFPIKSQGTCPRCAGTGIARRAYTEDQLRCTCSASRTDGAFLDLLEATAREAKACLARMMDADGWGACYHHNAPYSLEWRQDDRQGDLGEVNLDPDMPIAIAELIGLTDPPTVLRLVSLARQGLASHAP